MRVPIIIGFGHRARRGKDTAAQAIIESRGDKYSIRRVGFADALKREVAGRELELCLRHGIAYEPNNKYRSLLQWYGTDFRRKQDPFYWVKQIYNDIKNNPSQIVIIPDVRFINEAAWIKASEGFMVKLERVGYVDVAINASHVSESQMDGYLYDYEIHVGDGDVEELKKDAVRVFDMILETVTPQAHDFTVEAMESNGEAPTVSATA